jgi:hypothetical protein
MKDGFARALWRCDLDESWRRGVSGQAGFWQSLQGADYLGNPAYRRFPLRSNLRLLSVNPPGCWVPCTAMRYGSRATSAESGLNPPSLGSYGGQAFLRSEATAGRPSFARKSTAGRPAIRNFVEHGRAGCRRSPAKGCVAAPKNLCPNIASVSSAAAGFIIWKALPVRNG